MLFNIRTEQDKVVIDAHVTKIEVENIAQPAEDDSEDTYYRTIRFVGYDGEAIEVIE
jgi:hypothetical protein